MKKRYKIGKYLKYSMLSMLMLLIASRAFAGWGVMNEFEGEGETDDFLGHSVAIDGTRAIIGAPQFTLQGGYVKVMELQNGSWQQADVLIGDETSEDFGYAVDIEGDVIVVGDPDSNYEQLNDVGAVYIYTKNGNSWDLQKLYASDPEVGVAFGAYLTIHGSTLVVGCPNDNENGGDSGSAYIFELQGDTWVQVAKIYPEDGQSGDNFGYSLSINEQTIVVGAPSFGNEPGKAYVYEKMAIGHKLLN